jgi:hypothetical protein
MNKPKTLDILKSSSIFSVMFVHQYTDIPCYIEMFEKFTIGIHAAIQPLW